MTTKPLKVKKSKPAKNATGTRLGPVTVRGIHEWGIALETALVVAARAHHGQRDKNEMPYISHPLRVAARMDPKNVPAQIVALLHDAVEDTEVTLEVLGALFPKRIVDAIDAISRREGELYRVYMQRCLADTLARVVKHADLVDNLDPRRRYKGDEGLQKRYRKSLAMMRAPRGKE